MSPGSIQKAKNKLRKEIRFMIENIGTEEDAGIAFDGVGKLLATLGIFKELYENGDEDDPNKTWSERAIKEQEFHDNFWKLLTVEGNENADTGKLIELLVVLHDSSLAPTKELAKSIQSIIFFLEKRKKTQGF